MRRTSLAFTAVFALLAVASNAAADLCRVDAYQPTPVAKEVLHELADLGVAALPPAGAGPVRPDFPVGSLSLLRAGGVLGQIRYVQDPRAGESGFSLLDGRGASLFEMRAHSGPCSSPLGPPGLCREVVAWTALQPQIDGHPAIALRLGPDDDELATYFRYDVEVDFATFRVAFADILAWVRATVAATPTVAPVAAGTADAQLFSALAADPLIAPYIGQIGIVFEAGRLHVTGVAPSNEVYDLILQHAFDLGFYDVVPDMIIDTRTEAPPDLDPALLNCAIALPYPG
jgi:hypothetical protein